MDVHLADHAPAELGLVDPPLAAELTPLRWEAWLAFAAAAVAVVVVGGLLLTLTAELRGNGVASYERPMDKATAIHNLLFRQ